MPTSPSAEKRNRQNAKRRSLNNWRKRRVRLSVKSFLEAVQSRDVKTAEEQYREACGLLDRVACTSTMHRNTAARKKSRLARRLNELKASSA